MIKIFLYMIMFAVVITKVIGEEEQYVLYKIQIRDAILLETKEKIAYESHKLLMENASQLGYDLKKIVFMSIDQKGESPHSCIYYIARENHQRHISHLDYAAIVLNNGVSFIVMDRQPITFKQSFDPTKASKKVYRLVGMEYSYKYGASKTSNPSKLLENTARLRNRKWDFILCNTKHDDIADVYFLIQADNEIEVVNYLGIYYGIASIVMESHHLKSGTLSPMYYVSRNIEKPNPKSITPIK